MAGTDNSGPSANGSRPEECELSWRHDARPATRLFELIGLTRVWRFQCCDQCRNYLVDCLVGAKVNDLSLLSVTTLPLFQARWPERDIAVSELVAELHD